MKVVFCNRPDWQERSGGDVVQMLQTKAALELHHGLEVTIAGAPTDPALASADVVHVFNVQEPAVGLPYLRAAKDAGKKIALSTVFWDLSHASYVANLARRGVFELNATWKRKKVWFDRFASFTGLLLGKPAYYAPAYRNGVKEMVSMADVLLPNSREEGEQVAKFIGQPLSNALPVVNALDLATFPPDHLSEREGVIIAARIEPTKNTIGAILGSRGHRLTVVGRPIENGYYEAARRLSEGKVHFIDRHVPQSELAALYRSHRVHVLPSFRESPGLATLEALSSGCRCVVSERDYCPIDTYFCDLLDKLIFVCDPYDPESIASAIQKALSAESEEDLSDWRKRFTWKEAARQTFEAYRSILDKPIG